MVNLHALSLILLSFTGLAVSYDDQELARVQQVFETFSIPSALSIDFDPKALLEVTFPEPTGEPVTLQPAIQLPINATAGPPAFGAVGDIGSGPFVILAVDADPPPPFIAQIRHFLGSNFFSEQQANGSAQAHTLINRTAAIEDFLQPAPPAGSGTHRYVFLLYNQPEGFNSQTLVTPSTTPFNFSLIEFEVHAGLGDPIAGNFMLVGPDT